MRAIKRARPELESLESMTLLSGAAAAMHHHHAEVATVNNPPSPGATITLTGTERGIYFAQQKNPDTGKQYNLFAFGHVNPLGSTFTSGSFHSPGFIRTGTVDGSLTLRGPHGTLTLQLSGTAPGFSTGPFDLNYNITGGTGTYAGDHGTGMVDITVRPFGANSATPGRGEVGRVTLDFVATPSPTA